jgi:hypothetical protein
MAARAAGGDDDLGSLAFQALAQMAGAIGLVGQQATRGAKQMNHVRSSNYITPANARESMGSRIVRRLRITADLALNY